MTEVLVQDRESDTVAQRIHHVLHRHPALSPALVLVISMIVFAILNDRFLAPQNLSLVVQQVAVIGALAVGQTLIILTVRHRPLGRRADAAVDDGRCAGRRR